MVKAVVLGAAGKQGVVICVVGFNLIRCFFIFIFIIIIVCGILGGIGQPLALLLKANPLVTEVGFNH